MKSKPASQVTQHSTGPKCYPVANTAPKVVPEKGIGGFGKLKAATSTGPSAKNTASGFNPPRDSPKAKSMSGGSSRSGPAGTQGGTSSPTHGPGPGGLGQSGSKFPPIGG